MAIGSAIGNLAVLLSLDTAAFEAGTNRATRLMKQTQRNFQEMGQKISGVGKGMSIGITAPFAALMTQAIPAAIESREAMAQVEAGLRSMGGASGKTAEELKASARELQRLSTFDDDDILRKVTANLITFGNLSGDTFDRAQKAIVDMATRLEMDLQPATILVGKALNDPANGLMALGRTGAVSKEWVEANKAVIQGMVETGDRAGAQAMILKELEKQYENSGKAARDAAPGSDTIDAWRDFQETVGEIALNVLPPLTNILTKVLDAFNNLSPATQTVIVGVTAFTAAVGPLLMVVGSLVSTFGTMLPLLIKLGPAFAAVKVAALALMANPVVLGFAAVLAGIYLAWQNWDKIEPILRRLYNGVKTWIGDKLTAALRAVLAPIREVERAFAWLYDKVVGNSWVPDMVTEIADEMGTLDETMAGQAEAVAVRVEKTFKDMADATLSALSSLTSSIKGGGFLDILSGVIGLGMQLGSMGAFGKSIQRNLNQTAPSGVNVQPSGSFTPRDIPMPRMSPANDTGGSMRIDVIPSPYFDVRVNGQIQRAAPGIANAGAGIAQSQMAFAQSRRIA